MLPHICAVRISPISTGPKGGHQRGWFSSMNPFKASLPRLVVRFPAKLFRNHSF